ncbi:MAG: VTT domain-containing protein [Chloroflexi bacterium]|nr:VTT domain-containing protein [Chloroflexota bacterium]
MATPPSSAPSSLGRFRRVPSRYLRLAAFIAVIMITAAATYLHRDFSGIATVGYPALFLISIIGNASLVFPLPGIVAICWGGILLTPLFVGIVGGVGQGLGELTGYLAGFSGSGLAQKTIVYHRIQPWMRRRGWIVVLAFSLVPNPLFDIVGVIAGSMRMPLWQFLLVTISGKTLRSILVASLCSLGYSHFFLQAD